MLETFMDIFEMILKIITLYTGIMSIFILLPRRKKAIVPPKTLFAALIAARNEEAVISQLIESLKRQNYPAELYDIIVIPNNCTDETETVAARAGAKILHCTDPVSSKGEVLHQTFAQLMGQYDAYCVFDADNLVDPDFLARMNDVVAAGGLVAKSCHSTLNPYENWVSGSYDLYFQNINLLHSRARAPFSLSAKLVGTGFMVTDQLLQRMGGWNTVTLTEDIEFAAMCAEIGVQVHYVPEAIIYDEEPLSFLVSLRQRRRWSAGVISVARRYIWRLLKKRPSWLRWDLAAHISMIPVQLLALIPLLYGAACMPPLAALKTLVVAFGGFWLGATALALFMAITARRDLKRMWKAIVLYPLFMASWYPLHFAALFSKPKTWKPIAHGTSCERAKDKVAP